MRALAVVVALAFLVPLVPLATAEDPTSGTCAGVPLQVQVGLACALAGAGTNASCPPGAGHPIEVACTSLASWSWLAFSSLGLPGEATATVTWAFTTCVDRVGAEPACTTESLTFTETCAWPAGGECRGEGREDRATELTALGMGEQLRVLAHVTVAVDATATAGPVPVGSAHGGDASERGASVEVLCDGRDC